MKNYSFDNIIKEKADGHIAPVPADAWNNINKKRKKKRYVFFWWMLSLLLLTGLTVGIYSINNSATQYADKKINDKGEGLLPKQSSSSTQTKKDELIVAPIATNKDIIGTMQDANEKSTVSIITTNDQSQRVENEPIKNSTAKNGNTDRSVSAKLSTTNNKKKKANQINNAADNFVDIGSVNKRNSEEPFRKRNVSNRHDKGNVKMNVIAPAIDSIETAMLTDINISNNKEADKVPAVISKSLADTVINDIAAGAGKKKVVVTDTNLISKNSLPKKQHKKKIFIDVSTTGFIALQHKANLLSISRITVSPDKRSEYIADDIKTTVEPAFNYTLSLRRNLNKKFDLGIGIQYTRLKETIRLAGNETNTNYAVVKRLDNTGTFLYNDTLSTITKGIRIINASNSYDIISVPISVQYKLVEQKSWALSLSGGLNLNVKNDYQNSIEGTLVPHYSSAGILNKKEKKFTVDLFAGVRIAKAFGKNYQLYAEPTIQFNLMQYNLHNMINYKNIHRTGLTIGIAYQLNY